MQQGGIFLQEQYEIMLGAEPVGHARISREGLYSRFRCQCSLSGTVVCRIVMVYGSEEVDLGIAVPQNDSFCVDTRLPTKRIPAGTPRFEVRPRRASFDPEFIPIRPDEPFLYLSKLKTAYLVKRGQLTGVMFRER